MDLHAKHKDLPLFDHPGRKENRPTSDFMGSPHTAMGHPPTPGLLLLIVHIPAIGPEVGHDLRRLLLTQNGHVPRRRLTQVPPRCRLELSEKQTIQTPK